jgi:hypothetical protein
MMERWVVNCLINYRLDFSITLVCYIDIKKTQEKKIKIIIIMKRSGKTSDPTFND